MSLLTEITPPAIEPLDLDDVKEHARRDPDTIENSLISGYISSARLRVEAHVRRRLINQTLRLSLNSFPSLIELPMAPVSDVSTLTYLDVEGDRQTLETGDYRLVHPHGEPCVAPVLNGSWPSATTDWGSIEVDFVAGYGADRSAVPADILQALRLLVAHYIENREAVITGVSVADLPEAVTDLLAPHRRFT